jgi:hypothetical protein
VTDPDSPMGPQSRDGSETLESPAGPPQATGRAGGALIASLASLGASALACGIGLARLVATWSGAPHGGPTADSWVYQPVYTIVEVACCLGAVAAATIALTFDDRSRSLSLLAALVAAVALGWSLNDGAYQAIASIYYLAT